MMTVQLNKWYNDCNDYNDSWCKMQLLIIWNKKNQVDKSDKKVKFQFNEKHSMINEKIFTFHWQTHL